MDASSLFRNNFMKHNEEVESEAEKVGKSIKSTLRSGLPLWATGAESH